MSKKLIPGYDKPLVNDDGSISIVSYLYEIQVDMDYSTIRALGKPTDVHRGIFNGFSLPVYAADNEEIFLKVHIPHDWDATSNLLLKVYCYLDTANTDKKFKLRLQWEKVSPGTDTYSSTDTDVDVETITGTASQYQSFGEIDFVIAYSGISRGDILGLLLQRIAASADEIAGEVVITDIKLGYGRNLIGKY